jgi:nicotinamidase-related amidase
MAAKVLSPPAAASTALLVCDVQERFRDVVHGGAALIAATKYLLGVAQALGMYVVVSEQYPKAFGKTVPELAPEVEAAVAAGRGIVAEKTQFSMASDEMVSRLPSGTTAVVICGLEAHICVLQTARDLLARGFVVYIVADAVASQRAFDRSCALQGLVGIGARLTTAESVTYELLQDSKHPAFKAVAALVKARSASLAAGAAGAADAAALLCM